MHCNARTPSAAILAVASAFIIEGMVPAIDSNGDLLYKTGNNGSGCAAYLIASPEMQKIMANYTHQQANVCDLSNKEVYVSDMINAPTWNQAKRERFVLGLQDAHDKAAVAFKTLIEAGIEEAEAKSLFNFILHAELENLATEYGVKVAWPTAVKKTAHAANSGRPPSSPSHRRAVLDRVRTNAYA